MHQSILLSVIFLFILSIDTSAQSLGLNWVGQLGGDQSDKGVALSYDTEGNVMLCGTFQYIADLDPGIGEQFHTALGYKDSYIVKVSPEGSLLWAKTLGGNVGSFTEVIVNDIITDDDTSVIVVGQFTETVDFDPGPGEYLGTSSYGFDMFLLKLDKNGDFEWVTIIAGTEYGDEGNAIAYDYEHNRILMVGTFTGTVVFPSIFGHAAQGFSDGLLAIFNDDGEDIGSWQMASVDGYSTNPTSVVVGLDGYYVAGSHTGTTDFYYPLTAFEQPLAGGGEDIFVVKYDLALNTPVWSRSIGGVQGEACLAMASDHWGGSIVLTGYFEGDVDFDFSPTTEDILQGGAHGAAFILKIGTDGIYGWTRALIGEPGAYAIGNGIDTDIYGNIYTTGQYGAGLLVDFDPGPGTYNYPSIGGSDIYVHKVNSSGELVNFDVFQGVYNEQGNDILADSYGAYFYNTGTFIDQTDFIPSAFDELILTSYGGQDAYLLKYVLYIPPVSVDEQPTDETLLVYPNPTEGLLTVKVQEKGSIEVVDMKGSLVLRVNNRGTGPEQLDLSGFDNGVYSIRFVGESGNERSTRVMLGRN